MIAVAAISCERILINVPTDERKYLSPANYRKLIKYQLIDSMFDFDQLDIIKAVWKHNSKNDVNYLDVEESGFTNDKNTLLSSVCNSVTDFTEFGTVFSLAFFRAEHMEHYNRRIVVVTDRDLTADYYVLRSLGCSFWNNVNVFFFCIGDFETPGIEQIVDDFGGNIYKVTNRSDFTEMLQKWGPTMLSDESHSDNDGFADVEEITGLIYDQSGNLVYTDYQKEDTDDDGLLDCQEVDVMMTCEPINNEYWNSSSTKYYHKMHSNPMLKDTDGDGYGDEEDLTPMNFEVIPYLDNLCDLAKKYCREKGMSDDSVEIQLVLEFLRSKEYDGLKWDLVDGTIDYDFIDYVIDKNYLVYQFFLEDENGNQGIKEPLTNISYDYAHLAATMNSYFHTFEFESEYNLYYGSMNDMAGWAGDLQQVINDIVNQKDSVELHYLSIELAYDELSVLLGKKSDSLFGADDVIADADAINLIRRYYMQPDNLNNLINEYYLSVTPKQRIEEFIINVFGSLERSDVMIKAISYIRPPLMFTKHGSLYNSYACANFTEDMVIGFANAFCDYYFSIINEEREI